MLYYWLNFARVSNLLRAYRHIIDLTTDQLCPKWVEDKQTVKHWFTSCLALSSTRLERFGSHDASLDQLSLQSAKSVALAKKSL